MTERATRTTAVAALWCGIVTAALSQNGDVPIPVEVRAATRGDLTRDIRLTGVVAPRAQVSVYTRVPGNIKELRFEEGQRVSKGTVLAVIDEFDTLSLGVRQAEAQVASATLMLEQARKMSEARAKSQLEQARAGVDAATAVVAQVRELSGPRVETQVAQAEAGLDAMRATLRKIREGARVEEREQIQAGLTQATAALDSAESTFRRMKELYEAGAVSRQTFEGTETQLKVARAQHTVAKEQVKLVEEGARPEDIEAVEAQVRQADAALALAKSQVAAKTWELDLAQAESGLRTAQAGMALAQTAWDSELWRNAGALAEAAVAAANVGLEMAKLRLKDASVVAPITGVVARRPVDVGDFVNAGYSMGDPVCEIVDTSVLYAVVDASESDLPYIEAGASADVSVRGGGQPLEGTVSLIGAVVNPRTHTAVVKVALKGSDGIKPGAYADVTLSSSMRAGVVLVPRTALTEQRGDQAVLYVVVGDRAAKRIVTTSSSKGDLIEVTSGVQPGDQVIVSGQRRVSEGSRVRVAGTS